MTDFTDADKIRILIATDNHVGYEERDPIRKDDSWRSFDEVMSIAKEQAVDMVLLGGDLFHDNKPSRKSMYQVIRTLRKNCLGMKPCELEFLSDANEVFEGAFPNVNYEDPDINISIPVFSIHGNHDDPSGDGHFCSLDLLQAAGLVNYFGRVPEADNIHVKPILLQKGQTKLALYGISNVRDERIFRTFRDNRVRWFRPDIQDTDWFNILTVHQNHHAYTATSYLPETVLPHYMDLVVWGHEHECLIDPTENAETGFHVMQPGSSVATSLVAGEAVSKHVAIVSITGKDFTVEKIPLKTVRPFVTRDIVLSTDKKFKGLHLMKDNRLELTKRLMTVVDEMIEQANEEWYAVQDEDADEPPLPLIRLKVEYSCPEGGQYDCENPQRFSQRFIDKVANTNDVVYYHRKKASARRKEEVEDPEMYDEGRNLTIKVEELVAEYLAVQNLKILPQAPFGEAVNQYVNKDDKQAVEMFIKDALNNQVEKLMEKKETDDLEAAMEAHRIDIEEQYARGDLILGRKIKQVKPREDDWDSDLDGHWEEQEGNVTYVAAPDEEEPKGKKAPAKRGAAKAAPAKKAPAKKAPAKKAPATRSRPKKPLFETDDEDEDVIMDDDDGEEDEEEEEEIPAPKTRAKRAPAAKPAAKPAVKPAAPSRTRQTKLNFSQATSQAAVELSDDEISDDDDAFEPAPAPARRRR
ncbi:DNA repair protein [Plectosphaerella plurivora]|uniref:Double-strand break repair protein n=1 Tax=Plectosphaerella plurivora TaxID=936078 RepID=A0A9P8V728_9PEZI|nr:DNA repair protein [Plectosphaerella plurivora]